MKSMNEPIWDVSPIVCFETDKNKELAFKVMRVLVQKKTTYVAYVIKMQVTSNNQNVEYEVFKTFFMRYL